MNVIEFFINSIDCAEFEGKDVLEVGSKYVNGSVRPLIEKFCKPNKYVGVDIENGKFVDFIVPAEKLVEFFGINKFDVVISTEMLEHIRDWRIVINNLKEVLKPGGIIYITTVSKGFGYHAYPYDFWRYEIEDIKKIFSDFEILILEKDVEYGILLKAKKPLDWKACNLNSIPLYSMVENKRVLHIPEKLTILRKFSIIANGVFNSLLIIRLIKKFNKK
jgi:SAM-dependent methyltransferase